MRLFRLLLGLAFTCAAAIALVPPAANASATEWVPPKGSAIDQYRETLPGPGGDEVTNGRTPKDPKKVLGEKNAAKLEALGPDGKAAAELAATTDPSASGGKSKYPKGGNLAEGQSGTGQIIGQAIGVNDPSGGVGWLVTLIIAAATLGALAFALTKRRGAGDE